MGQIRELNRKKILDAAKKIVAEKGAANTTLRNIANEAGISNGALYYYFRSKDLILYEIMDEETAASAELAKNIREKTLSQEEIEHAVKKILTSRIMNSEDNRLFFHLANEAMLGNTDIENKFKEKYDSWFKNVDDIVSVLLDVPKSPKSRAIANLILAGIDGLCLQKQLNIETDLEQEWQILQSLILRGNAKNLL